MTRLGTDAAGTGPPADPATLRALGRARRVTRDLADDLLTHLPDLGDIGTQRALDNWVEQAADTLRALSEGLEERLIEIGRPSGRPRVGGPAPPDPGAGGAAAPSLPGASTPPGLDRT